MSVRGGSERTRRAILVSFSEREITLIMKWLCYKRKLFHQQMVIENQIARAAPGMGRDKMLTYLRNSISCIDSLCYDLRRHEKWRKG